MKNEEDLIKLLIKKKMHISCAESLTGGLLAATLINVSGASNCINESYVTYAIDSKIKILNVKKETIDKYNVVSENVAKEMVIGVKNISNADASISLTGLAGPNDDGNIKAGTVCFGFYYKDKIITKTMYFTGLNRNEVRKKSVEFAIDFMYHMVYDNE